MKVSLVQQNIIWCDPKANHEHLEDLFGIVRNSVDLIVLPEMFSTGFVMNPAQEAEKSPYPSLRWMKSIAKKNNCAVAGGVSVNEGGIYYNRFYFVKPDGKVTFYNKKHLFTYGGEKAAYTAGNNRVIVEWRGVRFLLTVCYDLRFPVWLRNRDDYDVILCIASWPSVRRIAWDSLCSARAIENQCYVCAVNRIGIDPLCEYNGGTRVINPYGINLALIDNDTEGIVTAELDLTALQVYRDKFPILSDADNFCIIAE
ncbi:MAG: amidohydrolase [Bacteroidales bacterium]|nr:amidohydrolase [Bacteroidales bacterium]